MTVILDKEEEQFNKDLAYSELSRLNTDVGEFLLKNRKDDEEEEKEHNLSSRNPLAVIAHDGKTQWITMPSRPELEGLWVKILA